MFPAAHIGLWLGLWLVWLGVGMAVGSFLLIRIVQDETALAPVPLAGTGGKPAPK